MQLATTQPAGNSKMIRPPSRSFTTLITDFDNTLYDWFRMWYLSFSAMLQEIKRISRIDEAVLIPQIRAIHQKYRTSEYAFLLESLPCLMNAFPGEDLTVIFDEAIHAYRRARKDSLVLYDDVRETLVTLRLSGVLVVIYTESLAFYTNYRIKQLGLDELVDFIFSPADHELPTARASHARVEGAALAHARHHYIPEGVVKPDPAVLLDIVRDIGRTPSECLYLGDSLMKDVAMAQDAKILDILAEYGTAQHQDEYELLRKVSHWTDAEVERERVISKRTVNPSYVISKFGDLQRFFR